MDSDSDFQIYENLRQKAIDSIKSEKELRIISAQKKANETYTQMFVRILERLNAEETPVSSLPKPAIDYLKWLGKDYSPEDNLVCTVKRSKIQNESFADVVGQEELKNALYVGYIYPLNYSSLFRNKSKGVMLYGPPGTGKSFIVKAATNELDDTVFFSPTTGELLGKYLGDVEKKIDNLYKCAAQELSDPKVRNVVIFLDEFDTIAGLKADDKSMARSVNALLQAMDGLGSDPNVSTIAATNYPWKIESAIRRRFSNEIFVDLAKWKDMVELMQMAIFANYYDIGPGKLNYHDHKRHTYDYLKEFGHGCSMTTNKRTKRGVMGPYVEESEGTPVNRGFLETFAKEHLGMDERAVEVINQIKSDRKRLTVQDEEIRNNMPRFGYSPSDITRIMQIAIGNASKRALGGLFKKAKINGLEYYVSVPPTDKSRGERFALLYGLDVDLIPPKDRSTKVLNFSFCEEDMMYAIANYKPTVGIQDYMDLVRYSEYKLSPDEE